MKCSECVYAADYIDNSAEDKKQCDITDEVHVAGFECNCVMQRQLYDKRNDLINRYNEIKNQGGLSSVCIICGSTVDNEYGVAKVCPMCKEAVQFISANLDVLTLVVQERSDQEGTPDEF